MIRRRRIAPAAAAFLWIALAAGPWCGNDARAAAAVRINGSGIAVQMMGPLVSAYRDRHPGVLVEMERPLGSSGAIRALLAGALDLAVTSRRLKSDEMAQGAEEREYGRTPMAIVTERNVPVSDITTRELEEIYAGERTEWPGGERIRVVLRPETDADTAILRSLSPGMNDALDVARRHPGMLMAVTDPESNQAVSTTPGGIGASGLPGVLVGSAPLKILTLNGVSPTPAALADGSYPLAKEILFVTTPASASAVQGILDFAYSPEGRAIAEAAGVLLSADARARP